MNVAPGASYEAVLETGVTGLAGTLEMLVQDNEGAVTTASSDAAITERPAGSGVYVAVRTAPTSAGQYTIVWSTDGSYDPVTVSTDALTVTFTAATPGAIGAAYATIEELARVLKLTEKLDQYEDQLTEVLISAAGEINSEIGLLTDDAEPLAEGWQLALAAQVNVERAVEHWHARPVGFGVIGLDTEAPVRLARDSWDRHAHKLAPLKASGWGIA